MKDNKSKNKMENGRMINKNKNNGKMNLTIKILNKIRMKLQ